MWGGKKAARDLCGWLSQQSNVITYKLLCVITKSCIDMNSKPLSVRVCNPRGKTAPKPSTNHLTFIETQNVSRASGSINRNKSGYTSFPKESKLFPTKASQYNLWFLREALQRPPKRRVGWTAVFLLNDRAFSKLSKRKWKRLDRLFIIDLSSFRMYATSPKIHVNVHFWYY